MHSHDFFDVLGTPVRLRVNTKKMRDCGIGKRNVFEAVASGGAGDL